MSWELGSVPPGMDSHHIIRVDEPKSPTDILPYTVDLTKSIQAVTGDTISADIPVKITVVRNDGQPNDLTVIGPYTVDPTGYRVTFWLADGSADYEYLVSLTVDTTLNQQITRSFILGVYIL